MFSGSIPALVTPFRDGAFDEKAFRRLIDWQIENGSSARCGTVAPWPAEVLEFVEVIETSRSLPL